MAKSRSKKSAPAAACNCCTAPTAAECTALTALFVWAHYTGHADPGTLPPPADLRELAAFVRLVIEMNSRLAEDRTRALSAAAENAELRATNAALSREIARLRGAGAAALVAPWDEPAPAADPKPEHGAESAAPEPSPRPVFRFPEDEFSDAGKKRAARGANSDEEES